jgi:hypothetical protein
MKICNENIFYKMIIDKTRLRAVSKYYDAQD